MNWFDTWKIESDNGHSFWDKGFTVLKNDKGRSLLSCSSYKSHIGKCYTVNIYAGSEGLELSITFGAHSLVLGIGTF